MAGGDQAVRVIPADHEAEAAVLAALLLDHDALDRVQDKLGGSSAFDHPAHRVVYEACLELAARRQAITLITLRNFLAESGMLEQIGGAFFLARLAEAAPTAAHIEHHAEILREKAIGRALIRTSESIARRGYAGMEPVGQILEDAEREVLSIRMGHLQSGFSSMRDEIYSTVRYIEQVQAGEITGVRTGFEDFDKLTGGLKGGELIVLAARPSMGKTALALNMARNHAVSEHGCVAFFSLEMNKRELVLRLLLSEAGIDGSRFSNGLLSNRDWSGLSQAASTLQDVGLFLDDNMAVTVGDLSARARRLDRERKLSLVVVDYIQLIQGSSRMERREQQVADISRSLKLLAKDLDVPILALSQLNRGPENRPDKRPQPADLRESGAIEQDADLVLFIYRDEVYNPDSPDAGIAEVIVAKHRNGPIGTVKLQFDKNIGRFHNLAGRHLAPPIEAGFDAAPDLDDWGPAPGRTSSRGGSAGHGSSGDADGDLGGELEPPF